MRTVDVTDEPMCAIGIGSNPELEPMLALTVRQRRESILYTRRKRMVTEEDELMILGAFSLLATGNACAVPEHLVELMTWCALEWDWLQQARPGE